MLLIELDGDKDAVAKEAAAVRQICGQCGASGIHSAQNPAEREQLWEVRRSIHGALAGLCPHWLEEDIAVPPASIPVMLKKLAVLAREQHLRILSFGHFADGNIHLSVADAAAPLSAQRALEVTQRIFSLTKALGGRIAAEHGIGLAKKNFWASTWMTPHWIWRCRSKNAGSARHPESRQDFSSESLGKGGLKNNTSKLNFYCSIHHPRNHFLYVHGHIFYDFSTV